MAVLVETRQLRQFKTSEDYLYAMKEDLAEWLNDLYPDLYINVHNFMDRLHTGVALCKHANCVRGYAEEHLNRRQAAGKSNFSSIASTVLQLPAVRFFPGAKAGTFFARDNVSNFITWCKNGLGVIECLLFETEDLITGKNEKHVILCLLEVARRGARIGVPAPMLVQMEREIDREIAADKKTGEYSQGTDSNDGDYTDLSDGEDSTEAGPTIQIVNNDLKSLDEMVRDLVQKCTCPTQFPMIRVSEGKYRIGDTKVLIFVRILRVHVMVRVGGGWDTLAHYLDKHDPCRCRGPIHQTIKSSTLMRPNGPTNDLDKSTVIYDRTRRLSTSSTGSNSGGMHHLTPSGGGQNTKMRATHRRSRSPTPYGAEGLGVQACSRSRSTTPRRKTKQRDASPAAGLVVPADQPHGARSNNGSRSPSVSRQISAAAEDVPKTSAAAAAHITPDLLQQATAAVMARGRASRQSSVERDQWGQPGKPAADQTDGAASNDALCRVSDNLRGAEAYRVHHSPLSIATATAAAESRPSTVPEEESGVDTAPSSRISDSLNVADGGECLRATTNDAKTKTLHSVGFGDDCKKTETVGADSGSEGSDVGYSSWQGPINMPPVVDCNETNDCTPPATRSSKTSQNLSKNGKQTPSPKTTPVHHRKGPKTESSPRHNNKHQGGGGGSRSQATTPLMGRKTVQAPQPLSRNNTWNEPMAGHWTAKHQLIADIVGRCAVIAPSPRRDPKPDSPVVTRIPAPVQRS